MIEVITAIRGAHTGLPGAFALADFEDVPSVGYQEGAVRGQPVEQPKDVAALDLTWDTLRGDALPRAASLVCALTAILAAGPLGSSPLGGDADPS